MIDKEAPIIQLHLGLLSNATGRRYRLSIAKARICTTGLLSKFWVYGIVTIFNPRKSYLFLCRSISNNKTKSWPMLSSEPLIGPVFIGLWYPMTWPGPDSGVTYDIAKLCPVVSRLHGLTREHVWKIRMLLVLRWKFEVVISQAYSTNVDNLTWCREICIQSARACNTPKSVGRRACFCPYCKLYV